MLSDEEKKAIEYLKRHIIPCYGRKGTIEFMLNDTILNLIEKQSKEIEELKEVKWYYEISRVPKDKIKAKIEELEKELEDIELKNINKDEISKTTFYFIDRLKCKIEVL